MERPAIRRLCASAALCMGLAAYAMSAGVAPAIADDYSYWYSGAQTKVYRSSLPPSTAGRASAPTTRALSLSAAQAEYEGRQLSIRPTGETIRDIWLQASDLTATDASGTTSVITADNVSAFKVQYVYVKHHSWGVDTPAGWQPDALLPMTLANGERLGWRPVSEPTTGYRSALKGRTQPFYVLFKVPDGAAPGSYAGTLTVTAKADDGSDLPAVEVPVALEVYPFSVAKRSLRTAFGVDLRWAMYAGSSSHKWLSRDSDPGLSRVPETTTFKADQIGGWLKYLSEHRLSPQTVQPAWQTGSSGLSPVGSDGSNVVRSDYLEDYLGTGSATTFSGERFGFNTTKLPEYCPPSYVKNPFSSSSASGKAANYYKTMKAQLGPHYSKAYAYPIDEPVKSQRSFIERYAAFIHKYAPGVKFLITTDPITWNYRPLKGVDIYVQRLQFYYRDYSKWVDPLRDSGKAVWIYSHASSFQGQVPNYLIDKPLTDPRAQGWFAYHTKAAGLMYFNVNAWRPNRGDSEYRDPYQDPVSWKITSKGAYANGDGSLLYPGYYPALGLHVQGSPPVGSLRMEALRDGLEDYEYAKLLEKKAGRAEALTYIGKVIGKPTTVVMGGKPTFPKFSKYGSTYISARDEMAARIAQEQ